MKWLVFLFAAMFLTACHHTVKTTPTVVNPTVAKKCITPGGTFKIDYKGALPKDKSIMETMCPIELFMGFKDSKTISILNNDPVLSCGRHITKNTKENTILFVDSDGTNLSGGLVMIINLGTSDAKPVLCTAYFELTFTRMK